jgi:aryl-alcohol dehydrogenase-like predicted oxidoreductase
MRYRLLGKSGLRVSEAALGAMTFGDEWGWGSPKAEAPARLLACRYNLRIACAAPRRASH